MAWTDVEVAVLAHVEDLVGGADSTATRQPANLAGYLPLILARRLPGRDRVWEMSTRVVVTVFAASRDQAWDVAEAAAVRLLAGGGFVSAGVEVDVTSDVGNAETPYADADIYQVVATYRVVARRAPAEL